MAGWWGLTITQYAYQSVTSPGMALEVGADDVHLSLNFGECTTGCRSAINGTPQLVDDPQLGVWYQVLIRIVRSAGSDGIVQAWVRKRGKATWTQRVNYSGAPHDPVGRRKYGASILECQRQGGRLSRSLLARRVRLARQLL
jgi:hypothetical protein